MPLRDALSKLLDDYDARRREDEARLHKETADDERFLARFAELRREVIRPVFEAAASMMQERGHGCAIQEEEFSRDAGGRVVEASISVSMAPAGMKAPTPSDEHARTLTFATRHYNRTVWMNAGKPMGSGGAAGSKGAVPLERLDRQLVEEELVKLAASVLSS